MGNNEDDDDDARTERAIARREAWLTEVAREKGFDRTLVDHAVLIARFFEASRDRYSIWHHDPVLAPILRAASDRYGEFRSHDFQLGVEVSHTEAVRAILALKLD